MSLDNVHYHIIKSVGPRDVQKAISDALASNEDEQWSEQRLGLDYFRVKATNLDEFLRNEKKKNSNIVGDGFRSTQIADDEIRGNGRLGAVARAVNKANGLRSVDLAGHKSFPRYPGKWVSRTTFVDLAPWDVPNVAEG
uniref:Uncharacterized protein n=1 Tax=Caenorhabditis japonica TaxID=281687 RepID=A0A8R1IJG1_CAEJA